MVPVKILIVDDLAENLLALKGLLRRDGVELLEARSGPEALELLLAHEIGLALLDVQMPEMDGFELAELMRGATRTRHVPIIFLTAGSHDATRMFRGYEVGAVDFLHKPIDPVLLGHKVGTFVELQRRRLEAERLNGELREALRLNELFVAALGHDLRSPLSTLVTGLSVLDYEVKEPSARKALGRMRTSAQRMVGMLDQLYDLARVRLGGGLAVTPADTSFRTLADRVCEELRGAYPGRELVVTYDGGSTAGTWDEGRLGQLLSNLVGNALRYGTPGTPVRLDVRGQAPELAFDVHNEGTIAEDARSTLFDAFKGSASGRKESLGLGLYIAHQIVVAHGGTIAAASTPESGTTFHVSLPRSPAA
jgi:two-component system, sensor histidine kinase and response regulator